jgi:hypothetical protein
MHNEAEMRLAREIAEARFSQPHTHAAGHYGKSAPHKMCQCQTKLDFPLFPGVGALVCRIGAAKSLQNWQSVGVLGRILR